MTAIIAWIACYLIGGIPFGYVVAKAKGIDITKQGSGNIGATNVGRVIGKKAYFFVLFLDIVKGALPGLIIPLLVPQTFGLTPAEIGLLGGLAAVIGHLFSPYLGFKGGKGIATGLGLLLGSVPIVAIVALVVWAIGFLITRLVSLASLIAVAAMVASTLLLYPLFPTPDSPPKNIPYLLVVAGLAIFIIIKHKENIKRIINKTEPKFTFSKTPVENSCPPEPEPEPETETETETEPETKGGQT